MRSSIARWVLIAARCTITSVSAALWKIEPALLELFPQRLGIGEVAVVGHGERAPRVVDRDGLGVLDEGAPRGGVPDVANGVATRQPGQLGRAEIRR